MTRTPKWDELDRDLAAAEGPQRERLLRAGLALAIDHDDTERAERYASQMSADSLRAVQSLRSQWDWRNIIRPTD